MYGLFSVHKSFFIFASRRKREGSLRRIAMSVWEIVLLGIALSMDAVAVGMTNGMVEPQMRVRKALLVALFYGFFQFLMPVLGYYCGAAFASAVEKIAPWLSFGLLAFIGGKMIFDCFKKEETCAEPVGVKKLFVQALATSIDALAVGVSLLAASTSAAGLPFSVWLCALTIGAITFSLSAGAVFLGKKIGNRLADKAELVGGLILIAIGLKILIESFL